MLAPEKLKYRKQFVISDQPIDGFDNFSRYNMANLWLYAHEELDVSQAVSQEWNVLLIGDVYSHEQPKLHNQEVTETALGGIVTFTELLSAFDKFCGSFLVIAEQKSTGNSMVFTDMAASREFFYTEKDGVFFAASQPVLLSRVCSLERHTEEEAKAFFNSAAFKKKLTLIADKTEFGNVFRLKANHYLSLDDKSVHRYAPGKMAKGADMREVAAEAAKMLRGFVEAASHRGKLAIPVSAGWESRVLLAASKQVSGQLRYFVYQHPDYSPSHHDVKIPRRLLEKLGLELQVITYSRELSDEIKQALDESLSFPRYRNFGYLINGLNRQLEGYAILNGNISEVARLQFDEVELKGGQEIALLQQYPGVPYAVKEYQQWYDENREMAESAGFRLTDLLYWEENSANWVAKTNTETRLVTDILQPFNCRRLIYTMYSVDERYRQRQTAYLYKEIVNELWPECLQLPVNPDPKKIVIKLMQRLGVYGKYRNLLMRYQLNKISGKSID